MKIGKKRGKRGYLPVFLLILALFLVVFSIRLVLSWNTPAENPGREMAVEIPGGATFVTAAERLHDSGVIRSVRSFVLLGKVRGLAGKIQAGELLFRTDMTPVEVLNILSSGRPISYPVTVPEGFTVKQIAALLHVKGLADQDRILELAEDPDFAASLGVSTGRLEGFLFPDTYLFPKGLPEEDILLRMVERFWEVYTEDMRQRARDLGMTDLQVVTFASIVERETGAEDERTLVSAVFHNRLKRGYFLQTDPTVIYGMEDFDGNLTKADLKRDHPYNTYTRSGLPPGPIASPGKASLSAALYPADVSYLYFVSRGDGTHVFSNSLVEHNKAVQRYQLGKGD
ncbi:MAG: endolytic transglycosylase MltG [bacterium]|nr:MAG: endolytic transglycosylase MltG [bacterium]